MSGLESSLNTYSVRTALSPNAGLKLFLVQIKILLCLRQNSAKPERGIETPFEYLIHESFLSQNSAKPERGIETIRAHAASQAISTSEQR